MSILSNERVAIAHLRNLLEIHHMLAKWPDSILNRCNRTDALKTKVRALILKRGQEL